MQEQVLVTLCYLHQIQIRFTWNIPQTHFFCWYFSAVCLLHTLWPVLLVSQKLAVPSDEKLTKVTGLFWAHLKWCFNKVYKKHFKIYFFIWELCHPSNTRWLVLTLLLFSQKLVFPSDKVGANKSERTFSPNYIWGRVYFTIHLCHCGWKDSKTVQITRVLYAVSHVLNFWSLQRGFKLLPGPRPCHTLVAPSWGLAPKLHQGRNNSRQKRAH